MADRRVVCSYGQEVYGGSFVTQSIWYQQPIRCLRWLRHVFEEQYHNPEERVIRFGEETMELMQCEGVTKEQAHALVEQVWNKPVGERSQELGGVMVTLATYLAVTEQDAGSAFEEEFARCERPDVIEKIRAKHKTKAVVSAK